IHNEFNRALEAITASQGRYPPLASARTLAAELAPPHRSAPPWRGHTQWSQNPDAGRWEPVVVCWHTRSSQRGKTPDQSPHITPFAREFNLDGSLLVQYVDEMRLSTVDN